MKRENEIVVTCDSLLKGAKSARGLAVIIDVYRAFTCAPLLFSLGIQKIILVATPAEGFALKKKDPNLILVGEVDGKPIDGFDLGNSPSHIIKSGAVFFKNKTIVQRTSSGVQGALLALKGADEVLLGSYAMAKATARYIISKGANPVSIVAMGWSMKEKAPEDEFCARYIAHLLGAGNYNHNTALRKIIFHKSTQKFVKANQPHFPPEDPILCLQRDIYDFVLQVNLDANDVIVKKLAPESGVEKVS